MNTKMKEALYLEALLRACLEEISASVQPLVAADSAGLSGERP